MMSMPDIYRAYLESREKLKEDFSTHTTRGLTYKSSQIKSGDQAGDVIVDAVYIVTERITQRRPLEYNLNVRLVCHFDGYAQLTEDQRKINQDSFVVTFYNSNKESYTSEP